MKWLWWVGPIVAALVYGLVAFWPTRRERWRQAELHRWVERFLGPLPGKKEPRVKRAPYRGKMREVDDNALKRLLGRLPGAFESVLETVGLGGVVGNVVLVPKLAYLASRRANRVGGSDHQTILARLSKAAPSMVVHPLPLVEGRRVDNRGVQFDDDPEFMEHYVVEGDADKAIIKWLRPAMREALVDFPEVWLRTEGKMVTITLYGDANAQRLDELVGTADAVFAERGAGGAPSLFGDEGHLGPEQDDEDSPPAEEAPSKLASVRSRLSAVTLDALLYALALAVLIGVLAMRKEGLEGLAPNQLFAPISDDPLDGAWQGGWTTKGFGAIVAAETLLAGLFVLQSYLAARHGQTIGMRLLGAQTVRLDGSPVEFFRGVLLRTWLLAAVPIGVAVALTRPFDVRAFITNLLQPQIALVALGVIVLDGVIVLVGARRRALHDLIAGTKVVAARGGWRRLIGI